MTITDRIRAAYTRASLGRPGRPVRLDAIRVTLVDLPRDLVDATLQDMATQDGVSLTAQRNPRMLTLGQKVAAVTIDGEDKHLIAIR
ncbi:MULTISPECIES: hypothetical protein [Streptosporangium]|uniref:Uncharacterized protein n=1 Tax=Streptosporangium pseudovulgare TaxID=35765 RepID=A0ABQ2RAE2_9ACTN|nr:hypothetical protein [Streptosporangium pseudovulgare]GGQ20871.1 hypothetical protein GCM10010140_58920 [Streptosporangium pseudovulgare]